MAKREWRGSIGVIVIQEQTQWLCGTFYMLVARKKSNITLRFQDQKIYMNKNGGGELERFRFAFVGFTSARDSFEDMVVKWTVSVTKIMHNPQRDKICSKRKEFKAFDVNGRLTEQRRVMRMTAGTDLKALGKQVSVGCMQLQDILTVSDTEGGV